MQGYSYVAPSVLFKNNSLTSSFLDNNNNDDKSEEEKDGVVANNPLDLRKAKNDGKKRRGVDIDLALTFKVCLIYYGNSLKSYGALRAESPISDHKF